MMIFLISNVLDDVIPLAFRISELTISTLPFEMSNNKVI